MRLQDVRPSHIEEALQGLVGCESDAILGNHFQRVGCPSPVEALQALLLKAMTGVSILHAMHQECAASGLISCTR